MSNQPNFRRAPSFAEFAEKRRAEGSIEIDLDDGGFPIVVPPGEFWTADTRAIQKQLRTRQQGVTEADVAISVIGEEAWDRVVASVDRIVPGMDPAAFFFLYLTQVTEEKQGETPGK